jgi:hypothetical protein
MNDVFCNDSLLFVDIFSLVANTIRFGHNPPYIIFKNFHKSSSTAQFTLRRLLEKYPTIKCIFITRSLSKIIDAIQSRTFIIRLKHNTIERDEIGEFSTYWEINVHNMLKEPTTANIYIALMNLIEPVEIFTEIFNFLHKKVPDKSAKTLEIVAHCEAMCAAGTKPVYHIENCLNLLKFHNII